MTLGALTRAQPAAESVFFVALLYLPQLFQKVFGQEPLQAGLALLPLMGTFAIVSFVAGTLYARLGAKLIVTTGAMLITAGILLLSFVPDDVTYLDTMPAMFVLGFGFGLFISTITTAAVTSLDETRTSLGWRDPVHVPGRGRRRGLGVDDGDLLQRRRRSGPARHHAARLAAERPAGGRTSRGSSPGRSRRPRSSPSCRRTRRRIIGLVRDAFVDAFQLVARVQRRDQRRGGRGLRRVHRQLAAKGQGHGVGVTTIVEWLVQDQSGRLQARSSRMACRSPTRRRARGATAEVPHGADVEVDGRLGIVRLL